jgi:Nif-specific regulatory protein
MGEAYMARGDYDTALEFLGHSRRIYERLGLEAELSRIFFLLGELYYRKRELFSARQFLNRTLETATLLDDWLLTGESNRVMAKVYLEENDAEAAQAAFKQAVQILETHNNPIALARACQDYALFLSESQEIEQQQEGLRLMEQAFSLYRKAGADLLARKADVMVKKFRRRYRDRTLAESQVRRVSVGGLDGLKQEIAAKFQNLLHEAEAKMSTEGFSDRLLEEVQGRIRQAQNELYSQIDGLSQQNRRLQQDIDFLMEEKNSLSLLQDISRTINSELDLMRLISKILDMVIEVLQAERGFLILRDKDGKLVIRTARNIDKDTIKRPEFKLSFSIAKRVVKTGEPILTSNAQEDARFKDKISVLDLKLKSVLCVPFKLKDQILGAVYVDNRFVSGLFSEKDLDILTAFSNQAAIALENARLYEENLNKQKELENLNRRLQQQVVVQRDELDKTRSVLEDSQRQLALKYDYSNIKGKSRAMQEVFHLLDRVIETQVPVLVQGESGTGKELVARAIHYNSSLKDKPFSAENCAALPESLLESELFGYKKGAFTGADRDKKGLFEIANGGSLFLDEVGEMSENMQKKLLRVLQDGEMRAVGGKEYIKVKVRLISATNKDLKKLVEKGKFRDDLYYRINVVTINLPPLRDRREDIPTLVNFFLDKVARESGHPRKEIAPDVIALLERYSWPGNVRELENEIARLVALSSGQTIRRDTLSPNILMLQHAVASPDSVAEQVRPRSLKDAEREAVVAALQTTGGNKVEAARLLGIDRTTLYNKMKRYGILE